MTRGGDSGVEISMGHAGEGPLTISSSDGCREICERAKEGFLVGSLKGGWIKVLGLFSFPFFCLLNRLRPEGKFKRLESTQDWPWGKIRKKE